MARVSEAALELSEEQFALPTRCTAWNVKELLAHMYRDVERAIVGLRQDPPGEADTDAVTYWTAYDPTDDAPEIADRAKTRAASYGSGHELAIVWDDMWRRAAELAEEESPVRVIRTWAPAMTLDEFLKTRALEITVQRVWGDSGLGKFEASVSRGGQRIASASLSVFQPPSAAGEPG